MPEKVKIAIIDDEEDLGFLLSNMLRSQGFEVKAYYSLKSGLNGLTSMNPQWVIIDNNLPDGSGWEKADGILQSFPDINIILISANPDSHRKFIQSNVHYLIKPLEVNQILKLLKQNRVN